MFPRKILPLTFSFGNFASWCYIIYVYHIYNWIINCKNFASIKFSHFLLDYYAKIFAKFMHHTSHKKLTYATRICNSDFHLEKSTISQQREDTDRA